MRFSPHASDIRGFQPTAATATSRGPGSVSKGPLMVRSSQPPATMWQGPSDNSSAMQSTNDRRLSHAVCIMDKEVSHLGLLIILLQSPVGRGQVQADALSLLVGHSQGLTHRPQRFGNRQG